jgi:Putative MetA-pathway of phenol degradation
MKIYLLVFTVVICFRYTWAQTSIQTDRPDQTECPFITPKGFIQAENGFVYERIDKDNKAIVLPSILWKYGINKNVELRLITEVNSNKAFGKTSTGFVPTIIGFKIKICGEKGIVPDIAFIGHLAIPSAASKEFKASYYTPSFRFNMQHTLSKNFTLY